MTVGNKDFHSHSGDVVPIRQTVRQKSFFWG